MLQLPKSTEYNRRVPKQKFYDKLKISPSLKKIFIEQMQVIYWKNKIAPTTANIEAGKKVTELQVFKIILKQENIDENALREMDEKIPYHILFLLSFENQVKACIAYKESSKNDTFKVSNYYYTDWVTEENLNLYLEGLNIDAVYENFIRQIAGESFENKSENIKELIDKNKQKEALEKKIGILERKRNKEKQLNRKMELSNEIKKLKKELNKINAL